MKFHDIKVGEEDYIKLPIPENYKDCLDLINSDLFRKTGKRYSTVKLLSYILFHPLSYAVWQRLVAFKGNFYFPSKIMHKLCSIIYRIDIPRNTKIGYGLFYSHTSCMVINRGTIIGNNVNISQFLSIGTNHNTPAVIGDNVYIGPTVCIVENVRIGSNSTIGAGAVVTKDVPANSTCAGVPAKILNYDNPGRYVVKRWIV